MTESTCKICRRTNQRLFLKGEKCFSPKCVLVKKPYSPGPKGKKRKRGFSEYGRQLIEKQKMKAWYGLRERQFRKYIKEVLAQRGRAGDAALALIKKLEERLDNVVFRMGFSRSRKQARELVNHSHFLVNGKIVNIASFGVKKGDLISIKKQKIGKSVFKEAAVAVRQYQSPSWIKLDKEKMEGKIVGEPSLQEAGVPVEISSVFEFYSR